MILHSVVTFSSESESLKNFQDEEEKGEDEEGTRKEPRVALQDGVIRNYEDHEESVYCAEWATGDPWVFASLSYDGRLIVNKVPRGVKDKILDLV